MKSSKFVLFKPYLCGVKNKFYNPQFTVGVLGGGQLGRMLIQEALNWNVSIHCLDPDAEAPCKNIASGFVHGDLQDEETVFDFGKDKDVVTIEIEHVNNQALKRLEASGVRVIPSSRLLGIVQDKGLQKEFYQQNNIPTSPFELLASGKDLQADQLPCVLKLRKGGYDGKGVQVLRSEADLANVFDAPCVREDLVDFTKEISVIVARNEAGEIKSFPVVDMEFNAEANLVEFLFSPATIEKELRDKARSIAEDLAQKIDLVGILAVEMFLLSTGEILVNEVAPRPHNSGHQTIEGNITSQYQQMLRTLLNLPLGSTDITHPSVMVNILGAPHYTGAAIYEGLEELLAEEGVYVHLYGKTNTKPFRKMGHFTVIDRELSQAKARATVLKNKLNVIA